MDEPAARNWQRTGVGLAWALGPLGALALMAAPLYPFIEDDSLISLRYARRLLDGHGLTWTEGVPVEGYSNLLWVLLTAALGGLGLDLVFAARLLGVLGVGLGVWSLWRLARPPAATWVLAPLVPLVPLATVAPAATPGLFASVSGLTAALWLCLSGPVSLWSIAGLEQPLLLGLLLAALAGLAPLFHPGPHAAGVLRRAWPAALPLTLMVWTRPDSPLFVALAAAILLCCLPGPWRGRLRLVAVVAGLPAAGYLLHLAFRLAYYGQWVPNTAYLKAAFRPERIGGGVDYLGAGLRYLYPWALGGGLGAVLGLRTPALRPLTLIQLAWLGAWLCYVLVIGGDHFPGHRHLVLPLGLCASLMAQGLCVLWSRHPRLGRAAVALAWLCLPALWQLQWHDPDYRMGRRARWQWDGQALGRTVARGVAPAKPLWAVTAAGCIPYFSGLPALDMLGLNDHHIARQPPDPRMPLAHDHGDGDYVLRRAPDLITFGLPTGAPPVYLSGQQMRRDPRFLTGYRETLLTTLQPHYVRSRSYVRVDGLMGVRRSADVITYPAYLLLGGVEAAPLSGGELGAWLPADRRLRSSALRVPPGRWALHAVPDNALLALHLRVASGGLDATPGPVPILALEEATEVHLELQARLADVPLWQLQLRRVPEHTARDRPPVRAGQGGVAVLELRGVVPAVAQRPVVQVLADFEGGGEGGPTSALGAWRATGDAMVVSRGPVAGQQPISGHTGSLLNSYAPGRGDAATGTLRSPPVPIPERSSLSLRLGGGRARDIGSQLGVLLRVDGRPLRMLTGRDTEALQLRRVDLAAHAGKQLQLEVIDQATGPFGHVLLDDVRLMSAR